MVDCRISELRFDDIGWPDEVQKDSQLSHLRGKNLLLVDSLRGVVAVVGVLRLAISRCDAERHVGKFRGDSHNVAIAGMAYGRIVAATYSGETDDEQI